MNFFKLIFIFGVLLLTCEKKTYAESELDKFSPEENVVHFMNGKLNPRMKYLLVKHYIDQGNIPFALRASQKIVELLPSDKKAMATLAYMQFKANLNDESMITAKKAYDLGDADSLVLYVLLRYQADAASAQVEIERYIPELETLCVSNIDAYEPLLIYGTRLSGDAKLKFDAKVIRGANLPMLIRNPAVAHWLLVFYNSINDKERISFITGLIDSSRKQGPLEPSEKTLDTTNGNLKI